MNTTVIFGVLCRLTKENALRMRFVSSAWERIFQSASFQKQFKTMFNYSYIDEAGIILQEQLEQCSDNELEHITKMHKAGHYTLIAQPRFKKEPPYRYPFTMSELKTVELKPTTRDAEFNYCSFYWRGGRAAIARITANCYVKSAVLMINGNSLVHYTNVLDLVYGEHRGIGYPTFSHERPFIIGPWSQTEITLYDVPEKALIADSIVLTVEYYEDFKVKPELINITKDQGANTGCILKEVTVGKGIKRIGGIARAIYVYTNDFKPIAMNGAGGAGGAGIVKINGKPMDLSKHIMYDMLRQGKYIYLFQEFPDNMYKVGYDVAISVPEDVNILIIRDNVILIGNDEMVVMRYHFG